MYPLTYNQYSEKLHSVRCVVLIGFCLYIRLMLQLVSVAELGLLSNVLITNGINYTLRNYGFEHGKRIYYMNKPLVKLRTFTSPLRNTNAKF